LRRKKAEKKREKERGRERRVYEDVT